jgi:hypothetical protein
MGIIGDIINLPIRLIKIPFKILALPVRIPMHIIFGSKKDQLAKEKADMEKQMDEVRNKATPFFMSGNPDDVAFLCKNLPSNMKDDRIKGICASARRSGGSRRAKRSIRRKTRRIKKILKRK